MLVGAVVLVGAPVRVVVGVGAAVGVPVAGGVLLGLDAGVGPGGREGVIPGGWLGVTVPGGEVEVEGDPPGADGDGLPTCAVSWNGEAPGGDVGGSSVPPPHPCSASHRLGSRQVRRRARAH